MRTLLITLGTQGQLTLEFVVRNTPLADLWWDRMSIRHQWPLDHPDRFYNFDSVSQARDRAHDFVISCIDKINSHWPLIDREFDGSQDCLNYLHSVFEQHHGLLDQQQSPFWISAPSDVRRALAELNLAVHRYESLGGRPRLVCTWFGMPKTQVLPVELQQQWGTSQVEFGTVYLNYVEIGKTVEDLAHDNDQYISAEAFQPWQRLSADFNVAFFDQNLADKHADIDRYIQSQADFFLARGIDSVYNVQARPMRFPLADLVGQWDRQALIQSIANNQWVHSVQTQ